MPRKGDSLEEALRQSWRGFRARLPMNLGGFLDPRTAFELLVLRNGRALVQALQDSREAMDLLGKLAVTGSLTDQETKALKAALAELAKSIPALGIFSLPGGSLLLPILAERLPWDIVPKTFRKAYNGKYDGKGGPNAGGDPKSGDTDPNP